jgi:hypothetical protein
MDKISWNTVEYLHKEKNPDWYWIVSIITISIALISIILNNIIFAILIIISSFTLALFASKKPEVITITLDSAGVLMGKNRYLYKDLDSFWIEVRDSYPRILFKSKKIIMPYVVILIEDTDQEKIKEFLLEYLPEEEHSEPLLEKILLYFGF